MAAASGFFAAMFDANHAHITEFTVHNLKGKTLKKIVDCFYTGKITLDHQCVYDIKKVAKQLSLSHIERKCDEYSADELRWENCVSYYYMCTDGVSVRKAKSIEMICKGFERLTPYHLEQMEVELLLHVLRSDKIEAPEEVVFGKIKDWVGSNEAERAQYVPGLMKITQLERISENVCYSEIVCCLFTTNWV